MLDYRQETAIWDGHAAEVYGGVANKLPHLLVRVRRPDGEIVERSSLSDSHCGSVGG